MPKTKPNVRDYIAVRDTDHSADVYLEAGGVALQVYSGASDDAEEFHDQLAAILKAVRKGKV